MEQNPFSATKTMLLGKETDGERKQRFFYHSHLSLLLVGFI